MKLTNPEKQQLQANKGGGYQHNLTFSRLVGFPNATSTNMQYDKNPEVFRNSVLISSDQSYVEKLRQKLPYDYETQPMFLDKNTYEEFQTKYPTLTRLLENNLSEPFKTPPPKSKTNF